MSSTEWWVRNASHTHTHSLTRARANTHTNTHKHLCVCRYMHARTQNACTHMRTYIHAENVFPASALGGSW